jgi:hypothetical protein
MYFRKGILVVFVMFAVASIAITFQSCASLSAAMEEAKNSPNSPDFGIKNDAQTGESMNVRFTRNFTDRSYSEMKYCFQISYRGSRSPDTLLMRIDNGSPITLRAGMRNIANSGIIDFTVSDEIVNQLLDCNNSIDLEFNTQGNYLRKWNISSDSEAAEIERAKRYNDTPRLNGPQGIKNFIIYYNEK